DLDRSDVDRLATAHLDRDAHHGALDAQLVGAVGDVGELEARVLLDGDVRVKVPEAAALRTQHDVRVRRTSADLELTSDGAGALARCDGDLTEVHRAGARHR